MNLCVVVAAHKPYWMPADPVYLPVQVGAAGKESIPGYTRDDSGENISAKNPHYCELTGLYWAWKNLPGDAIGLAHYRRHFARPGRGDKKARVMTGPELEQALNGVQAVLPTPRNYWIETNYSQYAHAHHAVDLDTTRAILSEEWPAYLPAYDRVMKRTWGHRFNMMVMRRETFDAWCQWLFAVLGRLEERLDLTGYSRNDARVFGFVSERLLDVWLETEGVTYREVPVVFLENQHWGKKIAAFLRRKLVGHN